jgi:3-hydroxyisobutyrate dehydrogenase
MGMFESGSFASVAGQRQVAVIGLGAMGLPIARLLSGELAVTAFDVDAARSQLAAAAGVRTCACSAEAAAEAGVILLALRTAEQATDALFGENGAACAISHEAIVALTSTIGSAAARRLSDQLSERGIHLLDAPISGGAARAASGDLLVFLGGSDDAISLARPVLDLIASTIVRVGPRPGDGQAMKTVNQLLCGIHVAAAVEALTLADSLGLDLDRTLEAMLAGAANSFMLENRGPRIVEVLRDREPQVLSRIDIFVKDMYLVADAARTGGIPAPLAGTAEQLFRLAETAGLAADDDSTLARLYQKPTVPPRRTDVTGTT